MMAQLRTGAGPLLDRLLQGLTDVAMPAGCLVGGITQDSRRVQPGDLFLALAGSRRHGATYVAEAITRGAIVVLLESRGAAAPTFLGSAVPVIEVPGLRALAGRIAARFHDYPARAMTVYGITGTNGKTSVSQFMAQALGVDGPCGVIGTLGSGIYGRLHDMGLTTPDAVTVQEELAGQRAAGARSCVLEVSSHALVQQRVSGVDFDVAVFTNLSHEHLDYHGDMENYGQVKLRLLEWPGLKQRVVNLDDDFAARWHAGQRSTDACIGYGFGARAHAAAGPVLRADELQLSPVGLSFHVFGPWGEARIVSPLLGRFNASNLLAALAALVAGGMAFELAVQRIRQVQTVAGRMERFGTERQPMVVVDYAHTPDALEQVLKSLREHCTGALWCVFGCGGERDRSKRPLMGQLAESLSDRLLLTDDNPRGEDPCEIIADIRRGMKEPDAVPVERDRATAICRAVHGARAGDVVLVAGKGHETVQVLADRVQPFSDREVAMRCLQERGDD